MAEPNKTEVEAMIGRAFRVTNDQERQSLYTSILTAFHMQVGCCSTAPARFIFFPQHNVVTTTSRCRA